MTFKDRLKEARKARVPKTTQADIAELVGVTPQAVSGWERGENMPETDKIAKIATYLGKSASWLLEEDVSEGPIGDALRNLMERDALRNLERIPHDEIQQTNGAPNFPIYASAEGGPGQIIRSSDPIDFQPRPTMLEKVVRAYGLIVTGDSMDPEYRSGDTALVNPHLPPISGEVFIFYAEQDGEARATIKQLRKATADKWLVSQHNPPDGMSKDFTLSRKEWGIAHRVVGKYSRR